MTLTISRGERPFIDILQDRCFLYGLIKSIYSGPCLGVAYISLSVYLYLSFFVAIYQWFHLAITAILSISARIWSSTFTDRFYFCS